MKSDEFDRAFDDGEDVTSQLDLAAARRQDGGRPSVVHPAAQPGPAAEGPMTRRA